MKASSDAEPEIASLLTHARHATSLLGYCACLGVGTTRSLQLYFSMCTPMAMRGLHDCEL